MLTSYPGFACCVAILRYTFVHVRMEFGRNKIFMADQKWRTAEQNGLCLDKLSTHFLYLISSSDYVRPFVYVIGNHLTGAMVLVTVVLFSG